MDARELTFREQFDVAFSNASLHWIIDHQTVLACVNNSLDNHGKLLFQMAGKGNAQDVIAVLEELISEEDCKPYFKNFTFPYGFYGPEEYNPWLREAGFKPERVELFPKDMKLQGKEGLAGWIRTTWLPFTSVFRQAARRIHKRNRRTIHRRIPIGRSRRRTRQDGTTRSSSDQTLSPCSIRIRLLKKHSPTYIRVVTGQTFQDFFISDFRVKQHAVDGLVPVLYRLNTTFRICYNLKITRCFNREVVERICFEFSSEQRVSLNVVIGVMPISRHFKRSSQRQRRWFACPHKFPKRAYPHP